MIRLLQEFIKSIPTLVLSLTLAIAVWISAVTAADPVQQRVFPRSIIIERIGQDPAIVITGDITTQTTVTLSAPGSVWDQMINDRNPIRAWVDLSGLGPGSYTLEVHVQSLHNPVRVVNLSPARIDIKLEQLATQNYPVRLVRRGSPAIGFQAEEPGWLPDTVTISGPASKIALVKEVLAILDINQASENINRVLNVQILDQNELPIEGLTIVPNQVTVNQPITRLGNYRNIVVKVTTTGQPAPGYRLTNVSVSPPNVTVFSNNPQLVDSLPGFIETSPLDLTGVRDDVEVRLPLNLPNGVSVVGDQTVAVQVGVAAIEDSITLSGLAVKVVGLSPDLDHKLSPAEVDVIISGPVLLLDKLSPRDVTVTIDLTNVVSGTYKLAPRVSLAVSELRVESILPSSIEVIVELAPTPTPTPTITPTVIITPTVTPGR